MRKAQYVLAILVTASAAQAQRLDTMRMSCDQARAVVARNGAVVLGSGPHIYDRYVSSARFCSYGELTQQGFAPTRDAQACPVGGLCMTPDRQRDNDQEVFRR